MKTALLAICASAVIWLGTPVHAAEPRIGKFVKYDTGDFVIVTSRSGTQAREIMQKLVKFRITLEKLIGKRAARSGIGTHIIIVSESDWEKYLQPGKNVGGYFQRARFDNYMSMNGDLGEFSIPLVFHEYTHFYLASQFAGEYPPWFNEGLAEVMAYAKFTKTGAVLQIPMFRVHEARDRDWIPFDRLIQVDHGSPEYQNHKLAESFYAQAWLTVHYGLLENRDFGRQFMEYLGHLNQLVPRDEAIRKAFGGDLGTIDTNLRTYARSTRMYSGGITLNDVPEVTLPAPVPLSEGDSLAMLIDAMLVTRLAPDRIRPLVQSLQRREPEAARSYILAARLAEFEDDSKAFDAAVDKAGTLLTKDDVIGRRELAMVLLNSADNFNPMNTRTSEDTKRDLKRALKWFAEGVERDSTDPKSLWGLGTVLTRLNADLDLADTALKAAYQRVPASASIAVSLANLKGLEDKPEEMLPYLKDTVRYASDLGTRRWATETLEQMQQYIVERKRVDEENRKQREAYEKQLADYEKKYGKPKKKPAKAGQ